MKTNMDVVPIGEKVLAAIDERRVVELGSDLIRIPSFKLGGETSLAEWLAHYFGERGYDVDLQEVQPGRYQTIATLPGKGSGPSLMFNGHIDIDPLRGGWTRDPWVPEVQGDLLYGAGIWNMKGGLSAMISAAEAIRLAGVELEGDLVVACVLGELEGGVGTTHMLRQGLRTDAAIVAEPVGAHNIITTHAGSAEVQINILGFSDHVSNKSAAVDAIAKSYKAITALNCLEMRHEAHPDLPAAPMLSVTGIIGGLGREHDLRGGNFVSDFVTLNVDLRSVPGQSFDTILEDIKNTLDAVAGEDPDFNWEMEMQGLCLNAVDVDRQSTIVQTVAESYRTLTGAEPATIGANLPISYGANDTAHLAAAGIPCLLTGPTAPMRTEENPDDCVSISEMVLTSRVMALAALNFCGVAGTTQSTRNDI